MNNTHRSTNIDFELERMWETEDPSVKDFFGSRSDEELREIYNRRESIFYLTDVKEEIEDLHQQMSEEFGFDKWGLFSCWCDLRFQFS
ncbi:MAG: hypothetical protein VW270_04790 [Candidatus Poseidoniales archaeon]